jgi:hypothetical protein
MRTVLVTHWGIGDHIIVHGLIRHYATVTPWTIIIISIGNDVEVLKAMFCDLKNIEIFSNENINTYTIEDDKYLLYLTNSINILRVGYFDYNYHYLLKTSGLSPFDCFYLSKNLEPSVRYNNFKVPQEILNESKDVYSKFIEKYGNEYVLIHEDSGNNIINGIEYPARGNIKLINRIFIKNKNLPIINLDRISTKIIDYYDVIINAKEIHLIDSSWSHYIYSINHLEKEKMKNISISMHFYCRDYKNDCLYTNPTHTNWNFIE